MVQTKQGRRRRAAAFASVALASVLAFAMLGGVELAQSAIGLVQYQYGKKVTICHKQRQTIRVSVRAWPAHKRHGDVAGTCAAAAKRAAHKHAAKPGAHRHVGAPAAAQTPHGGQSASKGQAGSGTPAAGPGKSGAAHGNGGGNGNGNAGGRGKGGDGK